MRILAVSVAPLFPDRVMGGSQRILVQVVDALSKAGHEVRLLSSAISDDAPDFNTPAGVRVSPVLPLRGSFPAQYQTAPHRLNSFWKTLAQNADWADRAYLHADAIYMRNALGDLPIIRSLHDYVYEEALLSAYTLSAKRTIVPSRYMADCITASARTVTDVGDLKVISNGVAFQDWPVEPRLPRGIEQRNEHDIILLHPHRLQPEKGIKESMKIAVGLQGRLPGKRVRLLVPALQPDGSADDAELASESVSRLAQSVDAEKLLEPHSWLSAELMPAYLAAGDVTLCPGSFVEAFGLVPLESIAAGTPAVCARVGALREQAGIEGEFQFDYGDIETAIDRVVRALELESTVDREARALAITDRFSEAAMGEAYVDAITDDLSSVTDRNTAEGFTAVSPSTEYGSVKLAPWCYISGNRIYHDYLARFERFPLLTDAIAIPGESHVLRTPEASELSPELKSEIDLAIKNGFLVPA